MTPATGIPLPLPDPERSRVDTRLYFDAGAVFGHRHARPSTAETQERAWDDEQLLEAARTGGGNLHPDLLTALCRRYVDLVQGGDEARVLRQQLAAAQAVAAAQVKRADALTAELVGERAERQRMADLHASACERLAWAQHHHAQVSYENAHLRHQIDGTTPVGVAIALDRAMDRTIRIRRSDIDGRFDASESGGAR